MDTKIYTNSELKDISVTKRVILIGDERCGKTCMSRVFNGKRFQFQYKPILFKVTTKEFRVMDNKIRLIIYDTPGSGYDEMRQVIYQSADVVVLCFSIDNLDSFANVVLKWIPEVKQHVSRLPIVLVGNKVDLRSELLEPNSLQNYDFKFPIKYEQGLVMANRIGATCYIECSAKDDSGLKDVFEKAAITAIEHSKRKKSSCKLI